MGCAVDDATSYCSGPAENRREVENDCDEVSSTNWAAVRSRISGDNPPIERTGLSSICELRGDHIASGETGKSPKEAPLFTSKELRIKRFSVLNSGLTEGQGGKSIGIRPEDSCVRPIQWDSLSHLSKESW